MEASTHTTAGIILAGGQSRRLGHDKRRLRLWGAAGPMLLEHTVATLAPLCQPVIVVFGDAADAATWPLDGVQAVVDRFPDAGVVGGIATGLYACPMPAALVVAADMPLLNTALLRAMRDDPRPCDVLVPRALHTTTRNPWQAEPLHARYQRTCLPALAAMLARGQRRISDLLERVQVAWWEPEQTRQYDPHGHSFWNINTAADLAQIWAVLHYRQE